MGGRARGLCLVAAEALFLWMFLAADPLEQLAAAGAFGGDTRTEDAAFALAAAWRHGMAGNSPLYLPGFFAVALAAWIFSEGAEKRAVRTFALGLLVAFVTACAAAPQHAHKRDVIPELDELEPEGHVWNAQEPHRLAQPASC